MHVSSTLIQNRISPTIGTINTAIAQDAPRRTRSNCRNSPSARCVATPPASTHCQGRAPFKECHSTGSLDHEHIRARSKAMNSSSTNLANFTVSAAVATATTQVQQCISNVVVVLFLRMSVWARALQQANASKETTRRQQRE